MIRLGLGLGINRALSSFPGMFFNFIESLYAFSSGWVKSIPAEFTFARNTIATVETSQGLIQVAANTPRLGSKGLLIEKASTNKISSTFNANPVNLTGVTLTGDAAAVLSLVNDSAALAAAGLSSVCSSSIVYKLDNSAGTTVAVAAISGAVGNLNPHTLSVYIRGTGTGFRLRLNGVQSTTIAPTAGYQRIVTPAVIPATTVNQWSLWVNAGAVVYFILPQLEESDFATSPIITSGSIATRPVDNASIAFSVGANEDFTISGRVHLSVDGPTQTVCEIFDGPSNRVYIQRNTTGLFRAYSIIDGGAATNLGQVSRPGIRIVDFILQRRGTTWITTIDGATPTGPGPLAAAPAFTNLQFGATRSLGNVLNDHIQILQISKP